MKKVLFSIAIVVAGLLVASCGKKSVQNTEGADSTAVAEEQAVAEELPDTMMVTTFFSAKRLGSEWRQEEKNSGTSLYKKDKGDGSSETWFIRYSRQSSSSLEEAVEAYANSSFKWKKVAENDLGDNHYVEMTSSEAKKRLYLIQLKDPKFIGHIESNLPEDDPDLMTALESLSFVSKNK